MANQEPKTAVPPKFRLSNEYLFTVVSSWLVPGSGHWALGYRVRGVVMGFSILGLFWMGEVLAIPPSDPVQPSPPLAVTRKVNPVFFACQVGNGFSALVANTLWGDKTRGRPGDTHELDRGLPPYLNLGILFTSISGLLNYLLVLHVLDPKSWIQAALDCSGKGAERAKGS
jgi:hypothetical protein